MKSNIKNNKKDTLQGMKAMVPRRGCRDDNNGSSGEKSSKTKRPE